MYVDVTTEARDYDALGDYLRARGEDNRRRRIHFVAKRGVVALVVVVALMSFFRGGLSFVEAARTVGLFVLLLGGYLGFVYYSTGGKLKRRVEQVVEEEKAKPSPTRRYTITEEGVACRGNDENAVAPWNTIADIVWTERHIFVFGDREFPGVIPKRGFASDAEAEQFYSLAREYWEKARLGS